MSHVRKLDDPTNAEPTLLELPITDFPTTGRDIHAATVDPTSETAETNNDNPDHGTNTQDELVLIQLSGEDDGGGGGGLTMADLLHCKSVYILGNTSRGDFHHGENATSGHFQDNDDGDVKEASNSFTPLAARLIVEGTQHSASASTNNNGGGGKTLELMRVETSNTYVVVPPMVYSKKDSSSSNSNTNKRQKMETSTEMVTMPARSIGLIPGEDSPSCFFLDPEYLPPGHFAKRLRGTLSRWVYDPLDPPLLSFRRNEGDDKDEIMEEQQPSSSSSSSPVFGYTIQELAHICRTSTMEIEHAINHRVFGAEDALLVIPRSDPNVLSTASTTNFRYGMLSEEARQTVSMAIVSALLESDLNLVWKFNNDTTPSADAGMESTLLMEEIRSHWHRLEDGYFSRRIPNMADSQQQEQHVTTSTESQSQLDSQSQFYTPSQIPKLATTTTSLPKLAEEVIWHCLRPILHYDNNIRNTKKDVIPKTAVQLLPDEVAKLAAHHVFLRGSPKGGGAGTANKPSATRGGLSLGAGSSIWWDEEEFMEAWSMRIPSMTKNYEPRVELLEGIAIVSEKIVESTNADATITAASEPTTKVTARRWQYFPEAGLSLILSHRIKSMLAVRDAWTVEEAVPYLEKFVVGHKRGAGGKEGSSSSLQASVAKMLGKHAKAVTLTEMGVDGEDVPVTKFVVLPK